MSGDRGEPSRYGAIDAGRALAVINMVVFHFLYDYYYFIGELEGFVFAPAVIFWERCICFAFIIISGISLNFTRRGYKRGIFTLACGAMISAITYFFIPDQFIRFGVLSFLGCAMIITYALRGLLNRINIPAGMAASLILFILCFGIPEGYIGLFTRPILALPKPIYELGRLSFLGFPSSDYFSADYFPILPWIFLYFFGYLLWRAVKSLKLDRRLISGVPALGFIGRHSLIIYMLHQPVLYGICLMVLK